MSALTGACREGEGKTRLGRTVLGRTLSSAAPRVQGEIAALVVFYLAGEEAGCGLLPHAGRPRIPATCSRFSQVAGRLLGAWLPTDA